MKTIHLTPGANKAAINDVADEINDLLGAGKLVTVTVAVEDEQVSPREAASRLGFSRQHVVRLIGAGELDAEKLPGSKYWRIPASSILVFEERRRSARDQADRLARELDELGAPPE